MDTTVKRISLLGGFIALGVAMGYAFIYIPNVEFVTTTVFISGFVLGIKEGFLVGLLTETIYSLFNPYGMAAPPLFIAQVISMGFTGILGGILGKYNYSSRKMVYLTLGLAGLLATLTFAILTTLSFISFIGLSLKKLMGSLIYGLLFYAIHMISNTIIFVTIVPVLLKIIPKMIHSYSPETARELS